MEVHHRAAGLLRSTADLRPVSRRTRSPPSTSIRSPRSRIRSSLLVTRPGTVPTAIAARWYGLALDAIERTGRLRMLYGSRRSLVWGTRCDSPVHLSRATPSSQPRRQRSRWATSASSVTRPSRCSSSGHHRIRVLHDRAIDLADRALLSVVEPDKRAIIAGAASLAHSMTGDSALCRELFLAAESSAESLGPPPSRAPLRLPGAGASPGSRAARTHHRRAAGSGRATDDPIAIFEGLQLSFSVGLQRCDGIRVREAVAESADSSSGWATWVVGGRSPTSRPRWHISAATSSSPSPGRSRRSDCSPRCHRRGRWPPTARRSW